MMLTILRIQFLRLRNNPLELLLVFVMPVLFFSIFAMIFSRGIAAGTEQPVRVGLAVPDHTVAAQALLTALGQADSLECTELELPVSLGDDASLLQAVERAQNSSRYDLILQLPTGFDDLSEAAVLSGTLPELRVITDGQNAMAVAILTSRLKEYYARRKMEDAAQTLRKLVSRPPKPPVNPVPAVRAAGVEPISSEELLPTFPQPPLPDEIFSTPPADRLLGEPPNRLITVWDPPALELQLRPDEAARTAEVAQSATAVSAAPAPASALAAPPHPALGVSTIAVADTEGTAPAAAVVESVPPVDQEVAAVSDVRIEVVNPQADGRTNPRIAMYAAGIAVLFLLFACTGHAGTMLDEAESGTLDRILASHAGLLQILGGKWLGIFLMGCLQLTVMFVFADAVFGIELRRHAVGFLVMAVCTSAATSGFALLLATLCRSRAQLNAAATVIILSMSAIGGSMIPRFVMSERMKELGRWSFNAWALDGFQKVFWFRAPVAELQTEAGVLLGSALVMAVLTLLFSGRWKRGL
ncbi:MAG: ABC transporter permease [Planctomycetota bacterium]